MSAFLTPMVITFKGAVPNWVEASIGLGAAVIGRTSLGKDVSLGPWATLRGDGNFLDVGDGCRFLDRATVHIADGLYPTKMGRNIVVGRFALVHACTICDDCVLGDAAVVMDSSYVGAGAVIAAGALVSPGKKLDGGWLYDGNPVRPVRVCLLACIRFSNRTPKQTSAAIAMIVHISMFVPCASMAAPVKILDKLIPNCLRSDQSKRNSNQPTETNVKLINFCAIAGK